MRYLNLVPLLLAANFAAATEYRLGVVDVQTALAQTREGKKATTLLQAEGAKRQAELETLRAKMQARGEAFTRRAQALEPSVRLKQQLALEEEARAFRATVDRNQQEYARHQRDLWEPRTRRLQAVIHRLAVRDHYSLILNQNDLQVLYQLPMLELTQEVVRLFDQG